MQLFISNTLTRKKEEFVPLNPKNVRIYSCGPTVYGAPSIGNYRSFVFADILRSTLQHIAGYATTHVMNITDVGHLVSDEDTGEDKMQKGAKRDGVTARDVAKKYEKLFVDDLAALAIERFDHMPRATEHIPEQIALVQDLESKGLTYEIPEDGIYMDTSKVADYGKLLGPNYLKHIEGLQAGARVEDAGKKNPTDFALRKFSPKHEHRDMERDSPRGVGFPGWHIECSAMSSKYLGQQFDIHTGGVDHIPVHHTNEIAQSECGFGKKPRVTYRMHNAFLTVDGGKMGKSLGNAFTLEEIRAKGFDSLDLRYFYLTAQYTSQQDFTREALQRAQQTRKNLTDKVCVARDTYSRTPPARIPAHFEKLQPNVQAHIQKIIDAFLDDLNTPQALGEMHTALHTLDHALLDGLYWLETYVLKVGLFLYTEKKKIDVPPHIFTLAEQRRDAKQHKNYAAADALRNEIQSHGFDVKDVSGGYEIVGK